jgi:hypothetical protein
MDGVSMRTVVREVDDYLCQTRFCLKGDDDSSISNDCAGTFVYNNLPIVSERVSREEMRVGGIARAFHDQVLVIGDAAGLCDPLTGFGIVHSLSSGKAASRLGIGVFTQSLLLNAITLGRSWKRSVSVIYHL